MATYYKQDNIIPQYTPSLRVGLWPAVGRIQTDDDSAWIKKYVNINLMWDKFIAYKMKT